MNLAQLVNWLSLAGALTFTLWRGVRTDRLGAAIIAAAYILTPIVQWRDSWFEPQTGMMTVDILALIALIVLALRGTRKWPIVAAGFQTAAVLTHLAFLINPHALYRAYYMANFSIGYFILGAMVAGVLIEPRDHQDEPRERSHGARPVS